MNLQIGIYKPGGSAVTDDPYPLNASSLRANSKRCKYFSSSTTFCFYQHQQHLPHHFLTKFRTQPVECEKRVQSRAGAHLLPPEAHLLRSKSRVGHGAFSHAPLGENKPEAGLLYPGALLRPNSEGRKSPHSASRAKSRSREVLV